MITAQIDNAEAVAWICLIVGVFVLVAGVVAGFRTGGASEKVDDAKEKIDDVKSKVEDAKNKIGEAKDKIVGSGGLEAGGGGLEAASAEASNAADAASSSAEAAKSALDQVAGIVGSLPENIRFAGLLVLVGTVLISVATIQFGGTSLF